MTCSTRRPAQIRLARSSAARRQPRFLHHPLIRRVAGQKLSKAEGDTAIRTLLDAGRTPAALFGRAARLAGVTATPTRRSTPGDLASMFAE